MTESAPQVEAQPQAAAALPAAELELLVEAALMATDRALAPAKLAELLASTTAKQIQAAVASLNKVYEASGRSFRIEQVAGGVQIVTLPQFGHLLQAIHKSRAQTRLGPAALETLAIIAYKQPILRAEVEAIRGVACGEVIRTLMDRRLVKIVGRAEEVGRPMLYGTTKSFLEIFGLATVKDLPKVEDLKGKGL